MSSNKNVIVFVFFIFFMVGCSNTFLQQPIQKKEQKAVNYYKPYNNENRYIIFALEYAKQGKLEEANELFRRLYDNTLKEEYLLEYSKLSFSLKKYDDIISKVEKNRNTIIKNNSDIKRIYVLSLAQKNEFQKAEAEMKKLLNDNKSARNYEFLANIYIQKGEYQKAKEIFKNLYEDNLDDNSLINLTNVMYLYLEEKTEAINILESKVEEKGCDNLLCSKLLAFYQEEKNIDGVISVLKKTYFTFKENGNNATLKKVYKLLMYYLERKDINEAIAFLEETNEDNEKLLTLYRNVKEYDKAYDLVNKLYETSSNIDYLAQIAIIEFEKADNKRDVLDDVIKKFEDVLTVLDNHVYQNYLGYILIDYDIDIKKGMDFVKKALKKAPHNLAYIDSLAWGQYKLNDCKNAYINMKKVVDQAGLEDKEIKTHWEKIKECNK